MSVGRRITAIGLSIVGAGALAIAYLQHRRPELPPTAAAPAVRLEVIESRPLDPGGIPRAIDLPRIFGDPPRAKPPESPPAGRAYYVFPRGDDSGDGSRDQPWRSLQDALCKLEPGDRLTVAPGTYVGPFDVSSRCRDGTAERPIEVYTSDDATLQAGPDPTVPVLTLARAHWRLEGFEISAGPERAPAIRFAEGARHVVLAVAHVVGSAGDGIHVGPGTEDITIRDCHLHHLGSARRRSAGRSGSASGESAESGDLAAIRIFPGTRGIRIAGTRIHNIQGIPVKVVTPEEHVAAGGEPLPATLDLVVEAGEFQSDQEEW